MPYTPEQARDVLDHYKGESLVGREFWEAISQAELPRYFLQKFVLVKLYSDDLPGPRLVSDWHPDYPEMKCRGNVIVGVSLKLRAALEYEVIKDAELVSLIDRFVHFPWNFQKGAKGEYWTSPEEIAFMNTVLDSVITYIETAFGLSVDWKKAREELERNHQEYRNLTHG